MVNLNVCLVKSHFSRNTDFYENSSRKQKIRQRARVFVLYASIVTTYYIFVLLFAFKTVSACYWVTLVSAYRHISVFNYCSSYVMFIS